MYNVPVFKYIYVIACYPMNFGTSYMQLMCNLAISTTKSTLAVPLMLYSTETCFCGASVSYHGFATFIWIGSWKDCFGKTNKCSLEMPTHWWWGIAKCLCTVGTVTCTVYDCIWYQIVVSHTINPSKLHETYFPGTTAIEDAIQEGGLLGIKVYMYIIFCF